MYRTILLMVLLFTGEAVASVYKWVDEQGNVHYGDQPVTGQDAEAVELGSGRVQTGISDDRQEQREKLLEVMREDRLEKARLRKEQDKERKRKAKECKRLKKRYERYRHASGVYRKDKDGNRQYYSNEQRSDAEAGLRKRIKQACN